MIILIRTLMWIIWFTANCYYSSSCGLVLIHFTVEWSCCLSSVKPQRSLDRQTDVQWMTVLYADDQSQRERTIKVAYINYGPMRSKLGEFIFFLNWCLRYHKVKRQVMSLLPFILYGYQQLTITYSLYLNKFT